MITVENLHKTFASKKGPVKAVDGVSFTAADGQITGLLGPNGAGKTTTMRMLYTLMRPDQGRIVVDGLDPQQQPDPVRRSLGVLPDARGVYKRLTARENIAYFGKLYGMEEAAIAKRADALVDALGMQEFADRRTEGFSQGQRTKTAIARALVHEPKNVILDEPTNGLDAQGIHELRTMFVDLVREGTTIMLSSHLLAEVELICTRTAMMSAGRIVAQDSVASLLAPSGWVRVVTPDLERAVRSLQDGPFAFETVDAHTVRVALGRRPSELLVKAFVLDDVRVRELVVERPTLEDVFLERTGHGDIR